MGTTAILTLALLAAPAAGSLLLAALGTRANRWAGWCSTGAWLVALVAAITLFVHYGWRDMVPAWQWSYPWLQLRGGATLAVGLSVTAVSSLLAVVVTLCGTLVSAVSVAYLAHDANRGRYFALLLAFGVAMLALVLSPNLVQLFVCYEWVGLVSYLLIGFWHTREDARRASLQALLVNRVGDVLLLAGVLLCQIGLGETSWATLSQLSPARPEILHGAGWLIALGAIAKSAQLPYSGWLPDAMAGPTPVSALLHAATMVAAGVVVLVQVAPLLPPDARLALAWIGGLTALYGGWSAIAQFDLKRVLAYSTISQLGYMVLAVGIGAPQLALFHLVTHAFFKCGLFLAAAAILHHVHHTAPAVNAQDLRNLGGLGRQVPVVFALTLVCAAALMGLPMTSGFASKDGILATLAAWDLGAGGSGGWLLGFSLLTVAITAGYLTRWLVLIFLDRPRAIPDAGHRLPWLYPAAIGVLAVLSVQAWYSPGWFQQQLQPASPLPAHPTWLLPAVLALVAAGVGVAYWTWRVYRYTEQTIPMHAWRRLSYYGLYLQPMYGWLARRGVQVAGLLRVLERVLLEGLILLLTKLLVSSRSNVSLTALTDWLDRHLVDGLVRATGHTVEASGAGLRRVQTGRLQHYLLLSLLAVGATVLLALWLVLRT